VTLNTNQSNSRESWWRHTWTWWRGITP